MKETEARQFIKRLEDLCAKFERDCDCNIELNISEKRKKARQVKWIVVDSISLKID